MRFHDTDINHLGSVPAYSVGYCAELQIRTVYEHDRARKFMYSLAYHRADSGPRGLT